MATVFDAFNELNNLVMEAERNLEDARKYLDEMAAQFGFTREPTPPLPVRPPNPYFTASDPDGLTSSSAEG